MTNSETVIRTTDERYFAFVQCRGDSIPGQQPCGLVVLTEVEYSRQLDKPDVGWWCPHCGSSADYDDVASEEAQGVNDEPPEPDGECYRGGEAASALAESQAWIQRNLK
jgi:hypothetical protein